MKSTVGPRSPKEKYNQGWTYLLDDIFDERLRQSGHGFDQPCPVHVTEEPALQESEEGGEFEPGDVGRDLVESGLVPFGPEGREDLGRDETHLWRVQNYLDQEKFE